MSQNKRKFRFIYSNHQKTPIILQKRAIYQNKILKMQKNCEIRQSHQIYPKIASQNISKLLKIPKSAHNVQEIHQSINIKINNVTDKYRQYRF
jgi:hypothetical protein